MSKLWHLFKLINLWLSTFQWQENLIFWKQFFENYLWTILPANTCFWWDLSLQQVKNKLSKYSEPCNYVFDVWCGIYLVCNLQWTIINCSHHRPQNVSLKSEDDELVSPQLMGRGWGTLEYYNYFAGRGWCTTTMENLVHCVSVSIPN